MTGRLWRFAGRQARALADAPTQLAALPAGGVELVAGDVTGLAALRHLASAAIPDGVADDAVADVDLPGLEALVDELEVAGHGVVMTMGNWGSARLRWPSRSPSPSSTASPPALPL